MAFYWYYNAVKAAFIFKMQARSGCKVTNNL